MPLLSPVRESILSRLEDPTTKIPALVYESNRLTEASVYESLNSLGREEIRAKIEEMLAERARRIKAHHLHPSTQ
jgi:hypothetical protein